MKASLLMFTILVFSLVMVACTGDGTALSDQVGELTSSNQAELQVEASNVDDDMYPRPEDILYDAGIQPTIPAMTDVLLDSQADLELRYWSAIALGRTGEEEVISTLQDALSFENTDLRYGAVIGLGELGDEEAVTLLEPMLYDIENSVRSVTITSLSKIGGKQAVSALSDKLLDFDEPDSSIRMNAAYQLGRLGDVSAILALRAVLDDGSMEVRTAAAVALANLGDNSGMTVLVNSALDPLIDEWLRVDAINAIEALSGESFNYTKPYSEPSTEAEKNAALHSIESWWQINEATFDGQ